MHLPLVDVCHWPRYSPTKAGCLQAGSGSAAEVAAKPKQKRSLEDLMGGEGSSVGFGLPKGEGLPGAAPITVNQMESPWIVAEGREAHTCAGRGPCSCTGVI